MSDLLVWLGFIAAAAYGWYVLRRRDSELDRMRAGFFLRQADMDESLRRIRESGFQQSVIDEELEVLRSTK